MGYRYAVHPVTGEKIKAYASIELAAALAAAETKCGHKEQEWRRVIISKGGSQICNFCLDCGTKLSNPKSRNEFAGLPEIFDAATKQKEFLLKNELEIFRIVETYHLSDKNSRKNFALEYGRYLKSEGWKTKRERVLSRANFVCEGCGINPASEVHHLTYENRFMEFLFELVALCPECHSVIHYEKHRNFRSAPFKSDEGILCEGCRWCGEENHQRWCTIHDVPAESSLKSENLCHNGRNGFEGLK